MFSFVLDILVAFCLFSNVITSGGKRELILCFLLHIRYFALPHGTVGMLCAVIVALPGLLKYFIHNQDRHKILDKLKN